MKKLTARQEQFVVEYIKDANGAQAAVRAGFSKVGARQVASRLLSNVDIQARIDDLRAPIVDAAKCDLASHLKQLADLRDAAKDAEQFSAAVSAETNRGKASGLYTERLEVSGEIEVLAFRRRSVQ